MTSPMKYSNAGSVIPQGGLTPRTRQEVERPALLRTRRPVPLVQLTASFQTILTARTDADFLMQALWVAETSGTAKTYDVCLVAPSGSASAANAVAWQTPLTANQSDMVIGAFGLLVPPGYTVQARASVTTTVNIFGHGIDLIGMGDE